MTTRPDASDTKATTLGTDPTAPESVDMSGTDLLGAVPHLAATPNGVTCNTRYTRNVAGIPVAR